MELTLSEKLKKIEEADEAVRSCRGLEDYCSLNPCYAQRAVMLSYTGHPLMSDVLAGKTTIEKTTDELSKVYKGWRMLIPHPKDEQHNKKVEELNELIPGVLNMRTRGIFAFDNPITAGGYVLGAAYCIGYAYLLSIGENPDLIEAFKNWQLFERVIVGTGSVATVAVICSTASNTRTPAGNPVEHAKYLDSKVKELF